MMINIEDMTENSHVKIFSCVKENQINSNDSSINIGNKFNNQKENENFDLEKLIKTSKSKFK